MTKKYKIRNNKRQNTNIRKQVPFVLNIKHAFGSPLAALKLINLALNDQLVIKVSHGIYDQYIKDDDYINICLSDGNIEHTPKTLAKCMQVYGNYNEDLIGNYCLCCSVIKKSSLKYDEFEMSRGLYFNFGEPPISSTFLIYPLFPDVSRPKTFFNCSQLTLNLINPDPTIDILRNNEKNCTKDLK